ncbi:MAG: thymidylate kinase [Candidatus Bathyarchaeota archaeon BA1]|nr:MAG: thymidylate kinase [Candidatus Bathyarchaeota archaeon BA1]
MRKRRTSHPWIEKSKKADLHLDLAIYIDIPPEVVERIKGKRSVMETLQTQQKVREVYKKLIARGRLISINGNRPADEVAKDILALALDLLLSRN